MALEKMREERRKLIEAFNGSFLNGGTAWLPIARRAWF